MLGEPPQAKIAFVSDVKDPFAQWGLSQWRALIGQPRTREAGAREGAVQEIELHMHFERRLRLGGSASPPPPHAPKSVGQADLGTILNEHGLKATEQFDGDRIGRQTVRDQLS